MCFRSILVLLALGSMLGCSDGDVKLPEATTAAFNAGGAPTVEFSVPDMMCPESCAAKTKEILAGQPGAKDVIVDFEAKTARVAVEEGAFDADAALAALVDHGFDHSALKTELNGDAAAAPQAANAPAVQ
jgi:copper chaperone CopZ